MTCYRQRLKRSNFWTFFIVRRKILAKGLALFCLVAIIVRTFGADTCSTYSGPECPLENQQTMITTSNCSRSCVYVWPLIHCMMVCTEIGGPKCCKPHQKLVTTGCCANRCIDILGKGDKCDDQRNSMCHNMPCVDGICQKLQ